MPIVTLLSLVFISVSIQILITRFRWLRSVPVTWEIGWTIVGNYVAIWTVRIIVPRRPLRGPLLSLSFFRLFGIVSRTSCRLLPWFLVGVLWPSWFWLFIPAIRTWWYKLLWENENVIRFYIIWNIFSGLLNPLLSRKYMFIISDEADFAFQRMVWYLLQLGRQCRE